MMKYHPHIIYSNCIELLYEELKERLFADTTPFAKRIVRGPNSKHQSVADAAHGTRSRPGHLRRC